MTKFGSFVPYTLAFYGLPVQSNRTTCSPSRYDWNGVFFIDDYLENNVVCVFSLRDLCMQG